jgi:hypothetical protein
MALVDHRLSNWPLRFALAAVTALSVLAVTAPPASASETHAGRLSSSIYLSRSETVRLDQKLNEDWNNRGPFGAAVGPAAACGAAGIPGAAICATIGEFSYAYLSDVAGSAARNHGCLRIRYIPGKKGNFAEFARPPVPLRLYDDGGKHCKD